MTAIVEDLLLLARSDSGAVELERVPVDLERCRRGRRDLDGQAGRGPGRRASSVDPPPAVITGDPARLRQLVVILVDNAIRYSPSGGHVSVRVGASGPAADLVVEDQGPGISPGGAAPPVRTLLPRPRRTGRRHRPGPRDRRLDRGSPRRPQIVGREPPRGRRALQRDAARRGSSAPAIRAEVEPDGVAAGRRAERPDRCEDAAEATVDTDRARAP